MVTPYQTGAASIVVGLWVMTIICDLLAEVVQQVGETLDICAVKWGVDFVQNAEGAGLDVEEGEQQGGSGQSAFAAGEKRERLALFTGDLHENVNARFEDVIWAG